MAKGKAKTDYLGSGGLVGHTDAPDWSFIYETSLVKDAKWNIGDRVVLPDGREFRYSKSVDSCAVGQGAEFTAAGYVAYTVLGVSVAAEDTSMTVPAATHAALTKDELRGGYVVVYSDANSSSGIFRGIVGNDAADADAAFVIYLDGPLKAACVAATAYCEVFQNPYAALRTGGIAGTSNYYPKAGIPAAYVSAANTYFWLQIKGFVWCSPHANVGDAKYHGAFMLGDGTICTADEALGVTVVDGKDSQYAGYVAEGAYSGNGPLFCLQL